MDNIFTLARLHQLEKQKEKEKRGTCVAHNPRSLHRTQLKKPTKLLTRQFLAAASFRADVLLRLPW
jgi:hypothetical protein